MTGLPDEKVVLKAGNKEFPYTRKGAIDAKSYVQTLNEMKPLSIEELLATRKGEKECQK